MALNCPHCQHPLNLKAPKPGRYLPKCPKCEQSFTLTIPADPQAAPIVAKLPAERQAVAATAAHPAQAPKRASPKTDATAEFNPSPATAAFPNPGAKPGNTAAKSVAPAGGVPPATKRQPAPGPDATAPFTGDRAAANRPASVQKSAATAGPADPTAIYGLGPDPSASEPGQTLTLPMRLGGYELIRQLGVGGMGEVYLARQVSLDRNVAVKTMRPQWARDPVFVARFTKEAFAAAQLVHHNVVQIYDIAAERDTSFFSMEFVEGGSLAQLLKKMGKLDVEMAVGYILQAARGLALAHQCGMVHRDIKPDNLLLNKHGIVKIADLGIVKSPGGTPEDAAPTPPANNAQAGATRADGTPGSDGRRAGSAVGGMTQTGVGIGTPAFMAPEQARDAASVDGRADIYSLGCTLYVLVTGRPPFEGRTFLELITKHATEPVIPPEAIVKRVPKSLSEIILRMVAKKPEERFQSMQELILVLERFLGVDSTGPFSPREEHARQLEEAVEAFHGVGLARLRPKIILGFWGLCLSATLICVLLASWQWAGAFVGLAVLTPLAHFVLSGILKRTYLFSKTRALVFGSRISDWLTWLFGFLAAAALLYFLGLLFTWLGVCLVAALLAAGFYFGVDRRVDAARRAPSEQVQQLLKRLRLLGLEEDALRQFVSKYSGNDWEEFYEALFGYEAKLSARDRWGKGENGVQRPRFAVWRDPLVRSIDARLQARAEAKQHKHLVTVEQKGLQATGLSDAEARKKAEESATATMRKAALQAEKLSRSTTGTFAKRTVPKQSKFYDYSDDSPRSRFARLAFLVGPRARFIAGGILLLGCLAWMHQNDMLPSQQVQELAGQAASIKSVADLQKNVADLKKIAAPGDLVPPQSVDLDQVKSELTKARRPLAVPLVPGFISAWFGNFFAGGAGLILGLSAFFSGRKVLAFVLVAALLFAAQAFVGAMF
jgi:serine/threonine protein kinase